MAEATAADDAWACAFLTCWLSSARFPRHYHRLAFPLHLIEFRGVEIRWASAIMRWAAAATLKSWGDGSAGAVAARLTLSILAMVAAGSFSGLTSIETSPPMA